MKGFYILEDCGEKLCDLAIKLWGLLINFGDLIQIGLVIHKFVCLQFLSEEEKILFIII